MKKIPSDYNRFVKLEGVGEVSRPVDIDQGVTGFSDLVSLRIYKFLERQVINGEAEEDEVCIVFLGGDVTIEVTGEENHTWTFQGRKRAFDGLPHVVYLPPHYHYKLSPHTDAEVAYARAKAEGHFPPRLIEPKVLQSQTIGQDVTEHRLVHILKKGDAERLRCAEYYLAPGHERTHDEQGLEQLVYVNLAPSTANVLATFSDTNKTMTLAHGDSLALEGNEKVTLSATNSELYSLHLSVEKSSG
jgi:5-deoxy-D-glucuronate isomerase